MQSRPVQPAVVQGKVIDAVTGQPLFRATVQLRGGASGPRSVEYVLERDTSTDGTFIFQNVPPGDYSIHASRSGYISNSGMTTLGETVVDIGSLGLNRILLLKSTTLNPGQTLTGIEIPLTPGGVIYGRLSDDRGDEIVGATVQALRSTFRGGRRERQVVQSVATNDLGEYRLFNLPPGEYRISVTPPGWGRATIPWFFPGTVDSADAQAIDLHVGQVLPGISFSSVPTRAQRVAGNVYGAAGNGASAILSSRRGDLQMEKTVDPNTGAFEFNGVPPGAYTLVGRTAELKAGMLLDVPNADISNARITLAPGFKIPVRVRIEGHGEGPDPELERLFFIARLDPAISGLEIDKYSPFEDGRLIFDLIAGNYWIEISQPTDAYIASMKLGDLDVLNQGLRVAASSEIPLEIVVGKTWGGVSGRTTGKDTTVVLVPDAARRNQMGLYQSARMTSSGEFQFVKVPPGEYKLFAWREENGGPWREPEYLRKYEDRAIPVRVESGKKTVVEGIVPVF
jgi:hypothetical protein